MMTKQEIKAFLASEDWANLVTMTDVAERINVENSTVWNWRQEFSDFPEMLSKSRRSGGDSSFMSLYWWPEVQEFLKLHNLPRARPVRNRNVSYGENLKKLAGSRVVLESQVKKVTDR